MVTDSTGILLLIATGLIGLLLIPLGLPGLWVILLGILGYGWLTDFQTLSDPSPDVGHDLIGGPWVKSAPPRG